MKNIYGVLAALSMMGLDNSPNKREYIEPSESEEERKLRLSKAEIERNKANGLQNFYYGENSVWALNKKNADKKAKKNNWI